MVKSAQKGGNAVLETSVLGYIGRAGEGPAGS